MTVDVIIAVMLAECGFEIAMSINVVTCPGYDDVGGPVTEPELLFWDKRGLCQQGIRNSASVQAAISEAEFRRNSGGLQSITANITCHMIIYTIFNFMSRNRVHPILSTRDREGNQDIPAPARSRSGPFTTSDWVVPGA